MEAIVILFTLWQIFSFASYKEEFELKKCNTVALEKERKKRKMKREKKKVPFISFKE